MRILINITGLRSGGGLSIITNLLVPLYQRGSSGQYRFLATQDQLIHLSVVRSTDIVKLPNLFGAPSLRQLFLPLVLYSVCAYYRINLLFNPTQFGPVLRSVKTVSMITTLEPALYKNHNYSLSRSLRLSFLNYVTNRTISRSALSVFVSHTALQVYSTRIKVSNATVIRHGVPNIPARTYYTLKQPLTSLSPYLTNENYFLSVGSFLPYRRYEDIIHGYIQYQSSVEYPLPLYLVGPDTDIRYYKYIRQLSSKSKLVFLLPAQDTSTVYSLISSAAALILSSEIEACPITALEGLAFAAPLVAVHCQHYTELCDKAPLYYEKRNTSQLANLLSLIHHSKSTSAHCSERSQAQSTNFSWDSAVKQLHSEMSHL